MFKGVAVISIKNDVMEREAIKSKFLDKDAFYVVLDDRGTAEISRYMRSINLNPDNDIVPDLLILAAFHAPRKDKLTEVVIGGGTIGRTADGKYKISLDQPNLISRDRGGVVLDDLVDYLSLKLEKNYEDTGFIKIETSDSVVEKVAFYATLPKSTPVPHFTPVLTESVNLEQYAQTDDTLYRQHSEGASSDRRLKQGYTLDYERVVHSKAFRRMVDKAQVFSSSKGDHYRTRMTHTTEVCQIARASAKSLKVNISLTEAIALAHDVGHTPFGHQGERSLNDILRGKSLGHIGLFGAKVTVGEREEVYPCNPFGGFKHNFQSVRVLSSLEESHIGFPGLNLSAQVLEGALWHTGAVCKDEGVCEKCKHRGAESEFERRCCEASTFFGNPLSHDETMMGYVFHTGRLSPISHSVTLEGQIVALADEVAQRSHDIDDALAAGLLTVDELIDLSQVRSAEPLSRSLLAARDEIEQKQSHGAFYVDAARLLKERVSSIIVNYLIDSILRGSLGGDNAATAATHDHSFGWILTERIVKFDPAGEAVCKYLENVVTRRALSSSEVCRFDRKAQMVVEGLFEAYYTNPLMLPRTSLRRVAIAERTAGCPTALDLSNCTAKAAGTEIERIRDASICHLAELPNHALSYAGEMSESQEYAFKKKLLVRAIVDHIAGMTDSYAVQEYDKIYGSVLQ